jgi:hypothetical protein
MIVFCQGGPTMSDPAVHIAAWEADGLIDGPLAERLRQAVDRTSGLRPADSAQPALSGDATRSPTSIGSFFGPSATIGEMFAYLGVAFLLGAWIAFLARIAGTTSQSPILTVGTAAAAIVMVGLGIVLVRGDARRRRGAGASFLAAVALAAGATQFFVLLVSIGGAISGLIVAGVAVAVAASVRRVLPAVTTQIGLLASLTGLAAATLGVLHELVVPPWDGFNGGTPEPIGLVLVTGAIWLLVALGLGALGLYEARSATTDATASRRAIVTRFWAGLVAVIGLTTALTRSGAIGEDGYGRILEPWIADVAILVLAAVLVERAFRRDTTAFIVAAAIALITALTDFNFSYLSQSTDIGLLIEGAILLAVGFLGDRLRRRMDRSSGGPVAPEADERDAPGIAPA